MELQKLSTEDEIVCLECYEQSKWICEIDERLARKQGTKTQKNGIVASYKSLFQQVHGAQGSGVHPYHPKPKSGRKAAKLLNLAPGTQAG